MALSSFQKAFKEARENGETEFEFPPNSGKMFNTKYKEEVKTSAKPVSPMPAAPVKDTSNYSNEGRSSAGTAKSSAMPDTYRDLSGKVKVKEPSGPSASQMASDMAMSGAKKIGSGISDYISNFETPAERRSREAKEASGMKRGGSVKKMASGGNVSSASKRADGIAQKGKTRGKMC
jgi:hypothetical protein